MMDRAFPGKIEAERAAYLYDLLNKAVNGDEEAGGELSKIALGGFPLARELVRKMDEVMTGYIKVEPVRDIKKWA